MPVFDGTGPMGMGQMTGKGFGPCGPGWRKGFRVGRGMGRYFGWNLPQTKKDQLEILTDYKRALKEELEDIKKEEEELSKEK